MLKLFSPVTNLLVPDETRQYTIRRGPHKGLRWVCNLQEDTYRVFGFHEHEVAPFVGHHASKADIAADVGAGFGWYTVLLADHAETVYALEPDASRIDSIKANLAANELDAEILPHACGVDGFRIDELDPFPDFVKVDVEGAEIEVLRSAGERVSDASWVVETHGPSLLQGSKELLEGAGLTVETVEPNTLWLRDSVMNGRKWLVAAPT